MQERLIEGGLGLLFAAAYLLMNFPGGTILMATVCEHRRLGGLDWVLSVIIPAYALLKVVFNASCR